MRIANSDMFLRIDADSPDFTIVPILQLGFRASDNDAMFFRFSVVLIS